MSILVTKNGIGGPQVLCIINDDESEINQVIKEVLDMLKSSYGEEEVSMKDLKITHEVTDIYPTIFKSVEISCKSSVDTYKIWIEFHRRSLKELISDKRTFRNIIM